MGAAGVGGYLVGRAGSDAPATATAAVGGITSTGTGSTATSATATVLATQGAAAPSAGRHQVGITLPAVAQSSCLVAIADLEPAALARSLAALGQAIGKVTDQDHPVISVTPDGPGDLTAIVGLGAGALAATAHRSWPERWHCRAFAVMWSFPPAGGAVICC